MRGGLCGLTRRESAPVYWGSVLPALKAEQIWEGTIFAKPIIGRWAYSIYSFLLDIGQWDFTFGERVHICIHVRIIGDYSCVCLILVGISL